MKKSIVVFLVILLTGMLVGCNLGQDKEQSKDGENNQSSTNTSNNKPKTNSSEQNHDKDETKNSLPKIEDYYPLKKNTSYIYEGIGNEFASYQTYNDYVEGKKLQQRVNNGGTELANVIEIRNGQVVKLYSRGEAYYRENLLKENGNGSPEILLKEPLRKGTQWILADSRVRTITELEASITTPTGTYKAIEVTTEGDHGKTLDYYAKNVGLVKSIFTSDGAEIISSLAKIEENVPHVQEIQFYYPNIDDSKLYYKNREVHFYTNDITRKVLAEEYKKLENDKVGIVFSKNTAINSLYLNKDSHVYIDLNKEFINEMSAGAAFETMILQSIVNTFGVYYQSDRVYLTINNAPYESGHITKQKGEYFLVDVEGAVKLR
ncbi:GerMN domain-containing protein [Bacillus marasmi]|uniref:GerMN domain-containing protein n=1 Tax=Bacillus marasmi TaxID=1926279 RepID=UPI0011C753BD|nr:GerMN domain-containing protein [Bacillus marasmi]